MGGKVVLLDISTWVWYCFVPITDKRRSEEEVFAILRRWVVRWAARHKIEVESLYNEFRFCPPGGISPDIPIAMNRFSISLDGYYAEIR